MTKFELKLDNIEHEINEAKRKIELLRRSVFSGDYKPSAGDYNFGRVLDVVCEFYSVDSSLVTAPPKVGSRLKAYTQARHTIFYLMRKNTPLSWSRIGGLCNRDHASAMYGAGKISDYVSVDKETRREIETIEQLIKEDAEKNCPDLS